MTRRQNNWSVPWICSASRPSQILPRPRQTVALGVTSAEIDLGGKHDLFNMPLGRFKDRGVRRDPCVPRAIQDPQNPYRHLEVRDRVVEITQEGADKHINKLLQKSVGKPIYPHRRPAEVCVKVEPSTSVR